LDLAKSEWFGSLDLKVTIHVIDSSRPISLANLFMRGDHGNRVVIWDDDDSSKLIEEKKAWETLEVSALSPITFFQTQRYLCSMG
jgi:cell division control protein 45